IIKTVVVTCCERELADAKRIDQRSHQNMNQIVSLTRVGDIGVISINHPPVNALSQPVRAGLKDAIAEGNADSSISALVIHCEGRTFIAGADIREFGKPLQPPSLDAVIDAI